MINAIDALRSTLSQHNIRLLVTWEEDEDHLKCCVAYKYFNKLRKESSTVVTLVDLAHPMTLHAVGVPVPWRDGEESVGRGTNDLFAFLPSSVYVDQCLSFIGLK